MPRTRSLSRLLALAGAAVLSTACLHLVRAAPQGQGMSMPGMDMGGKKAGGQQAADVSAVAIKGETHITVYVLPGDNGLGFTGPDKARHDTMVPSSFVLRRGVRVTVTVINLDEMKHSITAPGLGVNIIIKAGIGRRNGTIAPSTTTYTFTPAKAGEFRWYCVFPCDMPQHWAMTASYDGPDRDGFMAGIIRVL
ncbi:MAG TPA: cupredoxin domain-containing protein [Steroidobacteraceae bacterium]|nr:cupredoxin domain-containing protein [Steroidobacteraceae bacterium]